MAENEKSLAGYTTHSQDKNQFTHAYMDSLKEKERPRTWQEGEYTVTRTHRWGAPGCHNSCGVLYYTKNGKLEKVEGDPESKIFNGRLCARCLNLPEAVNAENRVKYPMKRVGKRGEDNWERVSWEEALDMIEEKTKLVKEKYGPEAIYVATGTGRNAFAAGGPITYKSFGTPNLGGGFLAGDSCYWPRCFMMAATQGEASIADASQMFEDRYDNPEWTLPECIVIWGNNPLESNGDGFQGHWIVDMMKQGSKLIVIDPRKTWLASRSEYHLQLRPGTDGAIALAWLNVIINEKLYDKDFVDKWTFGFEELTERVQKHTPEWAAEVTGVPAQMIIESARYYANAKPATVQWGVAIDMQINGNACAHAICNLWAITGNLDVPGGNILVRDSVWGSMIEWGLDDIPLELQAIRAGTPEYPAFKVLRWSHSDTVLKYMETGKPYQFKMMYIHQNNFITNMGAQAKRCYDAVHNADMEFIVAADVVMTPTIQAFADLVLPVAMSPEHDMVRGWWYPTRDVSHAEGIDRGEVRSDLEIMLEMGKRINPDGIPWNTLEDVNDYVVQEFANLPMTYKEMQKVGEIYPDFQYRKYEKGMLRKDGSIGFNTPTGRVELQSSFMGEWGVDDLPHFQEPPSSPVSNPEMAAKYPYVLTTGSRSWVFFHSENRNEELAREIHPMPIVQIHPDTAQKHGIEEGDWVCIENQFGKCKQKAELTIAVKPGVINGEHGWSFPERQDQAGEPSLYGVWESNINLLTSAGEGQIGPMGMGAPYKSQLCKIYRAEEGV